MAVVRKHSFAGVADNTVLDTTPTEVNGTGDVGSLDAAAGSPTIHVATDGRREVEVVGTATIQTFRYNTLNNATFSVAADFRVSSATAIAGSTTIFQLNSTASGALIARLVAGSDNFLSLQDTAGAFETKSTAAVTVGGAETARNRIAIWGSEATEEFNIRIYDADGTRIMDQMARPIGSFVALRDVIIGKTGAVAGGPWYWSNLEVQDVNAEITLAVAITASAGADLTNLEPYSTVSHTATHTASGTATHAWTATRSDGGSVTLTNANTATVSYKAPGTLNGVTVTLQYTVTGSNGTASDTVVDTILPSTDQLVRSAVYLAAERRQAKDANAA